MNSTFDDYYKEDEKLVTSTFWSAALLALCIHVCVA